MRSNTRSHSNYLAFLVHRISGLCLAIFLPVHLYVISLLLKNPEALDRFLSWTQTPLVKISETLLILLACAHLANGIRLIAYEFFATTKHQSVWIAFVSAFALISGLIYLLNA